jgi:hypothetical protein
LKKTIITMLFLCLCMAILAGCSTKPSSDGSGNFQIAIRGIIKDINIGKDGANILVEGKIEADTVYDKAMVHINVDTMIQKDDLSKLFKVTDLKVGDTVEVFFKGPVAESYPVQGTAEIVRIITQ